MAIFKKGTSETMQHYLLRHVLMSEKIRQKISHYFIVRTDI